jgi:uncharacterized membrane protein
MEGVEVRLIEWFTDGFALYRENFGKMVFASLIAVIISAMSVCVLAAPMLAGILIISLDLYDRRAPRPTIGTIFKGFRFFSQTFLFFLIWATCLVITSFAVAILPFIGPLASLFFIYVLQAFLMFGPFLIVDQRMGFWAASVQSFNKTKTNFWPFLSVSAVASIIGSSGAIVCGLGLAVTAPIQACILTVAYCDVFGRERAAYTNKTHSESINIDGKVFRPH